MNDCKQSEKDEARALAYARLTGDNALIAKYMLIDAYNETTPEDDIRRMHEVYTFAKENGFTCFSSVLGISRHKDLQQVNAAAARAAAQSAVPYDQTNWRKGGLEELRRALISEMQLYNQSYCGCVFSRRKN